MIDPFEKEYPDIPRFNVRHQVLFRIANPGFAFACYRCKIGGAVSPANPGRIIPVAQTRLAEGRSKAVSYPADLIFRQHSAKKCVKLFSRKVHSCGRKLRGLVLLNFNSKMFIFLRNYSCFAV